MAIQKGRWERSRVLEAVAQDVKFGSRRLICLRQRFFQVVWLIGDASSAPIIGQRSDRSCKIEPIEKSAQEPLVSNDKLRRFPKR